MSKSTTTKRRVGRKTRSKRKSGGGLIKTIKAKLQKRREKKAQKIVDALATKRRQEADLARSIARDNARFERTQYLNNRPSQASVNMSRDMDEYDYLMSGRRRVYDD
jgi:hypothetical protein